MPHLTSVLRVETIIPCDRTGTWNVTWVELANAGISPAKNNKLAKVNITAVFFSFVCIISLLLFRLQNHNRIPDKTQLR